MSRFFNETRKPANVGSSTPAYTAVDVQDAVDAIKKGIHVTNGAGQANGKDVEPLFGELHLSNEIVTQVAAGRLENCRKISLRRDNEKSFLAAQYNPAMQLAVEGYRMLRTRLVKRQTELGTRSMVISSAEQGEGKTLTALNLALCYANIQHWPVLLVDTDLRTRGLSRLLGDPASPGLAKILEHGIANSSAILATDSPNLFFLPAGTAVTPAPELFSQERWKEFIGWCAESFRLVIIDAPPVLGLTDFEVISAPCESVLLVVRSRKSNREALAKIRPQLDPQKLVGVVLNCSTDPSNKRYNRYGYGYGEGYGAKDTVETAI
jgi:capsular exopolysaccharide synthesis family protein